MRFLILMSSLLTLISCGKPAEFKTGTWRGVIDCQGHDLPFIFEVTKNSEKISVHIKNGVEDILLDEVSVFGDSVKIVMHIFDAELRAKINGDKLSGTFVKN